MLRAQIAVELRRKAARYADRALEVTAEIMENKAAFATDRLKAAAMLMDRMAGKPVQETIHETPDDSEFREMFAKAAAQTREVLALPAPFEEPMGEVTELRPRRRYLHDEVA